MSKLTGNQEFNGEVYVKDIGGYNGTNPSQAQSVKTVIDGLENEISRIDEVSAAALVDLNTKLEGIEVLLSEI